MVRGVLTMLVLGGAMFAAEPKVHRLEATPSTVAYGWYDAAGTPVLRIASGDILDVDTLLTNGGPRARRRRRRSDPGVAEGHH
jgi:hypothetical protein